jgi:hypothetical protein
METPIYDQVVEDLSWSLDELRPPFDLEGALAAAGELAREHVAQLQLDAQLEEVESWEQLVERWEEDQ